MPEITVDVEVFCGKCGAGLCKNSSAEDKSGYSGTSHSITVDPCEACLETSKDEGEQEGDTDGYNRGYAEGLSDGSAEAEDA